MTHKIHVQLRPKKLTTTMVLPLPTGLPRTQCSVNFKKTPNPAIGEPKLEIYTHSDDENVFLILTIRLDPIMADSEDMPMIVGYNEKATS